MALFKLCCFFFFWVLKTFTLASIAGSLWTMWRTSGYCLLLKCNKWAKKVLLSLLLRQVTSFLLLATLAITIWVDKSWEVRAMELHQWGLLTTKNDLLLRHGGKKLWLQNLYVRCFLSIYGLTKHSYIHLWLRCHSDSARPIQIYSKSL